MKKLTVKLRFNPGDERLVGTLAEQDRRLYFEYDAAFIATGMDLSPYKLPVRAGLIEHDDHAFGPLPGLFDDSLPDGWGLLLMDKHFRREGIDPVTLSPLDRLSYLGSRTMAALTYHPSYEVDTGDQILDLARLGENAANVIEGEATDVLPELMRAGGSPAGARPKVLVGVRDNSILSGEGDLPDGYEHWLIKFPSSRDAGDAGPVEYAYSLMARAAGIEMPETRLFAAGKGKHRRRYFGVKRFDRGPGNRRYHVHSFANLIHTNFRIPSTDYTDLFKVTKTLTRSQAELGCLFRQMVFNIASHNRDDHAKNFAFIFDENVNEWALSPAFDLMHASGPGGEQTMTVSGKGRDITGYDCIALGERFGIKPKQSEAMIAEVNDAVGRWSTFADESGVSEVEQKRVGQSLQRL